MASCKRMSLADYLAKNYLNADGKTEKKSRKRKRKDDAPSRLVIADDDTLGWERDGVGNVDDEGPLTGEIHNCSHHLP